VQGTTVPLTCSVRRLIRNHRGKSGFLGSGCPHQAAVLSVLLVEHRFYPVPRLNQDTGCKEFSRKHWMDLEEYKPSQAWSAIPRCTR
jgi:hypothetical protein